MDGACSTYGERRMRMGKSEEKIPLEKPGVGGRIILRWIFRKWDMGVWTGLGWFRIGTVGGHL